MTDYPVGFDSSEVMVEVVTDLRVHAYLRERYWPLVAVAVHRRWLENSMRYVYRRMLRQDSPFTGKDLV